MKNKRAQEEMIGFALIIIIVSIILLVFLGFFLNSSGNQTVQSYEAESFVTSTLQTSTQCQNYYGYISVRDLIFMCGSGTNCLDRTNNPSINSCQILNSTLRGILNQTWIVGQGSSIKGYIMNISSSTGEIFSVKEGNITSNSQGNSQPLSKGGTSVRIIFSAYS
ncbi:MAG: hypothetical protein WAU65_01855 [Candidatus Nanoarchaeia archaeon]